MMLNAPAVMLQVPPVCLNASMHVQLAESIPATNCLMICNAAQSTCSSAACNACAQRMQLLAMLLM
jgi:hypothetical protein